MTSLDLSEIMTTLPKKLVFVDLETTGGSATFDRVIEIGALRIEDGQLIKTFHSLINPEGHVPPEITALTGITTRDLENAPTFSEIRDQIAEIIDDCVFVAHNVRFDYGFLKNEFRRFNISFSPKHFCTVKLSRALFPEHRHHNLDAIIERFSFNCDARHRAYEDAQVLWDFFQLVLKKFGEEKIIETLTKMMKRPSLPINLPPETLDKLPEAPGVYIFYGPDNSPLYVGKSVNIRDRVLSHFSSDHSSSKEMKITQQIKNIETIVTTGELGALLMEASLVKKMQPLYNRQLRISRKLTVLKKRIDQNGYSTVVMESLDTISVDQLDELVGVFRSQKVAKNFLISVAKEHSLCEHLLGVEHTKGSCFGYRLGRCKGACVKKEEPLRYNMRFIMAFSKYKIRQWPFAGPILIEEVDPFENTKEGFIIDHWCHIASLQLHTKQPKLISNEQTFDLDAYKILDRFLRSSKNLKKIRVLTKNDLDHFLNL